MNRTLFFSAVLASALPAAASATLVSFLAAPIVGQASQPKSTAPTEAAIKKAKEINAAGSGFSLLIMHRGKVIAEDYPNGGLASRATELASGTKSFVGVLALAAQEDGLLKLDEPVSQTLTEWRNDNRKDMTIRQLLQLVGGLPSPPSPLRGGRVPSYAEAIQTETNAPLGARFQYGATPFMVFGEVMRRKLLPKNVGVLEYMRTRIFQPIGVQYGFWRLDRDGQPHMPSGAYMNASNWAKFGESIRLDGKGILKPGQTHELFKASSANPSYGLTWWLPAKNGTRGAGLLSFNYPSDLPQDIVQAAGAGGQVLMIIPSHELVIVRQAPVRGSMRFDQVGFLRALLDIPAK